MALAPLLSKRRELPRPTASDDRREEEDLEMKRTSTSPLWTTFLIVLLAAAAFPPSARAVPSFARQTGLSCTACHYTPPELNLAGRQFKLNGYVLKDAEGKEIKAEAEPGKPALNLLSVLPLSVLVESSFTSIKTPQPGTQNGTFEMPQDVSLFLSGAWTSHVGSFMQITYSKQDDHFSIDNTDIRWANKGTLGGKDLVYGASLNNNPTIEDLWNSTPAWGFPWIASDAAPTPTAATIIQSLGADVAGIGGYGMWNDHLYAAATIYRSDHVGAPQPNPGTDSSTNIKGVAPYWRLAWQESTPTTQLEFGTYGIHLSSFPGAVEGPVDTYTDWGFDLQYDRTINRRNVLSLRGTYIHENSTLNATFAAGGASATSHHLDTIMANAEYHFGSRTSVTLGFFDTNGTADPLLFPQSAVVGSANGGVKSGGYIANLSFWPAQNWLLGAQYIGYTTFNGAKTNYDGAGRDASANSTLYLLARFLF
jgi:hypothetical protein